MSPDIRTSSGNPVDARRTQRVLLQVPILVRAQFAGDDPGSQEYFDESIEGLIKDAFNQAPK